MTVNGEPGRGPMRVGLPVADLTAGFMLAHGILAALLERERSGRGQWVHTSLLQANIRLMEFQAARYLLAGEVPGPGGQLPPDLRADRRLPRQRQQPDHPGRRQRDVPSVVRRARGARSCSDDPRFVNGRDAT